MSFKDRLRETAGQAQSGLAKGLAATAEQAQGGLAKGQAKVDQFRSRQSLNESLQALGQAYWVLQAGRAEPAQLQTMFEAVGPAIRDGETRLGLLAWPTAPPPPDLSSPAAPEPSIPTSGYVAPETSDDAAPPAP